MYFSDMRWRLLRDSNRDIPSTRLGGVLLEIASVTFTAASRQLKMSGKPLDGVPMHEAFLRESFITTWVRSVAEAYARVRVISSRGGPIGPR